MGRKGPYTHRSSRLLRVAIPILWEGQGFKGSPGPSILWVPVDDSPSVWWASQLAGAMNIYYVDRCLSKIPGHLESQNRA
jgi:hypothetical protein